MGSTPRAEVILVAWDPESPEHVDRLYQQRVACGWEEEEVEGWRNLQQSGEKTVQWVVRRTHHEFSHMSNLIILAASDRF
jgi:hypothetical protein